MAIDTPAPPEQPKSEFPEHNPWLQLKIYLVIVGVIAAAIALLKGMQGP